MDMEHPSHFKFVREKFEASSRANILPAYTRKKEKPIPHSKPGIQCNPPIQGVISTSEKLVTAAPLTVKKPELPPKPNDLSNTHNMRLSKVFRQTLHITNSTRTEGDGMCANSPQVYRRSLPTFQEPSPETHQPQTQEVYEDVDSSWCPPPPTNDLKIVGGKHLPAPNGPNPVKMTSSPILDDNSRLAAKDKRKEKVHSGPLLKTLPSVTSLGPPPPKPPRPLKVDLCTFFTLRQNGMNNAPEESAEAEYDLPAQSPASNEDEVYDEVFSPNCSKESDSNAYELDDVEYDTPEAVNSAPDASRINETDEMLCYEEILKLRESLYSSNVYDTTETNSASITKTAESCIYEVSVDNNDLSYSSTMSSYPSIKSSVSEGYYSADLDASNETFRKKSKSKKVKMEKSRQNFKLSGQKGMFYTSRITEDFKTGKYLLPEKEEDTVEVIRITDCPAGKSLARDVQRNHGLVPVTSLQVINDIKTFSNQHLVYTSADQEVYADVEVSQKDSGSTADMLKGFDSYSIKSDDQYDDIGNTSQTSSSSGGKGKLFGQLFKKDKSRKEHVAYVPVFPDTMSMDRTTSQENEEYTTYAISDDRERERQEKFPGWKSVFHRIKEQKGAERKLYSPASGLKKFAREEKIFREKFKYMGEINVVNTVTINDLAPLSPKDKLELAVKPGETVEVIDVTSENQIICRNVAGKYGYVRIECLNF